MKKATSLRISVSGVRGVVGESLTPQLASKFAQAFGTYLGRGAIIVGQDSRKSGIMVKKAVISGLLSVGCQPVEIGISPIPSIQVLTEQSKAIGAIAVTASHNPKEWNGLKFINKEGLYLNYHQVDEFLDIYHQGEFSLVDVEKYKTPEFKKNPTEPHMTKLMSYFNLDLIGQKKFKVAIDCTNGAGAVLAPRYLKELGCEPVLLNCAPDGSFAHHPEPLPENIADLCRTVVEKKADVGFVQDADADRLAVVNEKGEPLGEELTLALASKYILSQNPGPVVINLSTSRAIDDIAAEFDVPVIRTKIGEINVVEHILSQEEKPAIGGEGNGGVILQDIHPCRDSFAAMGLILECMAKSGKTISRLQDEIPHYHMIKEKIQGTQEKAYRIIRQLRKKYADKGEIYLLDGLKISFTDYWVHIRPSNTEPIIRLIVEAKSRGTAEKMTEFWRKEMSEAAKWK
ncbi:MAG: phosphoglucosamine mutase [Candidatus Aminicenantes bacterium]|nr:MAG: phosphoglucosamine mutase [Candidatus Aminicenantes bacterium]